MPREQRSEGREIVNHVDTRGGVFQAKGAVSARALWQQYAWFVQEQQGGQGVAGVQGLSQQEWEARRPETQPRPKSFSLNDKGADGRVLREKSHGISP